MTCRRCGGCLAWEPCATIDIQAHWRLGSWRCLNCGEFVDRVIFRQRQAEMEGKRDAL